MLWLVLFLAFLTLADILFTLVLFVTLGKVLIMLKAIEDATGKGFDQVDINMNKARLRILTLERFLVHVFGLDALVKKRAEVSEKLPDIDDDDLKN